MILLALVFGLTNEPAPVPPPLEQFRANCVSPTYASDIAICQDAALLALDEEMAQALATSSPNRFSIEPQDQWFRRSRLCAFRPDHMACLRASYRERIAILGAAARTQAEGISWQDCLGRSERVALLDQGVIALARDGRIELAMAPAEFEAWTPWVSAVRIKRGIKFRWLDKSVLKCRLGRM